ncbi:MAG: aminotransferase class V-fold PLP-dependent enzyme [Gemmatimonadota bacterium]
MISLPEPPYALEPLRAQVPLLDRFTPMNHCSQAPQSLRTRAAGLAYLDGWDERGMDWDAWMAEVEAARTAFARLVGAAPGDVAVGSSVSQLVSSLATALPFTGPRTRVLASTGEFPTVTHAWKAQARRGAVVELVSTRAGTVDVGEFVERLDERVQVVSISHGLYESGFVMDVEAIQAAAARVGALTVVDAYQTLGTRPVDVHALGVDVLVGGCLKYLMGVPGLAFMYVRPEVAIGLQPGITGWFGRSHPFAFDSTLDWAEGARRFELGTPPIFEAHVCRAGIEWISEVGPAAIYTWTSVLSDALIEGGRAQGLKLHGTGQSRDKSPSTAFRVNDAAALEQALRGRGVLASARGPVLRLAPHFYSTLEDVERSLIALQGVRPR